MDMIFPHTSEILNFLQTNTHEFQQLACSLPPLPPLKCSHNLSLFTSHFGLPEISYKEKAKGLWDSSAGKGTCNRSGFYPGIKVKHVNQLHTAVLWLLSAHAMVQTHRRWGRKEGGRSKKKKRRTIEQETKRVGKMSKLVKCLQHSMMIQIQTPEPTYETTTGSVCL